MTMFSGDAVWAAPAPTDTVQELEDLAAVMEDKAAREQLLSRIRTLIATQKDIVKNTQVKPQVESTGARLVAVLSENVRETSRQLVAAANTLRGVPDLINAVLDQAANAKTRRRWLDLTP